jgi:hypothetical protein
MIPKFTKIIITIVLDKIDIFKHINTKFNYDDVKNYLLVVQ